MKRLYKITLFLVLTIILISSASIGKYINREQLLNSSLTTMYDTANFVRFIKVDTFRLSIIPPSSGIQFYKNNIVFLSRSKNERKMTPNQISFGAVEAYYASVEDSLTGRHLIFSPVSSFSYPCEAMTFSRDYNTVYFTKIPKKGNKEKIFIGKLIPNSTNASGLVSELQPLDFCKDNFNYSHPALSADENMMIFASDRDGSLGGMDLFISRKVGNQWSAPENLGSNINTTGNEFFPFLDSDNNLFFSSDKLPGYGGYDIFTCKFNGSGWDKPVNLSTPVNSGQDEIAFTINNTDGKSAFFTRRQRLGKAEMQLFRVTLKQGVNNKNLLTISEVFNGNPVSKSGLTTATLSNEVKTAVIEPAKTKTETDVVKKDKAKVTETAPPVKNVPEKVTIKSETKIPKSDNIATKPDTKVAQTDNKVVISKANLPTPVGQKDIVVYRVQLLPSTSQKNSKEIVLNGTSYKLYDYIYLGATRYAIGEFSKVSMATALQKICRQSGYPQSFVIVFKNNVRSLDPELFK
jgi:hypothetical protein